MKKITKSQIVEAIFLGLTFINMVLAAFGKKEISLTPEMVYLIASIIAMLIALVYAVWKNFPTSKAGRIANVVLTAIKAGEISPEDAENMVNNMKGNKGDNNDAGI